LAVTLDWLLERVAAPRVLKIDVEGMEHRVLAGATAVLSKARPVIWCEVDPVNKAEVSRILHAHDYDIFYANQSPSQRQPLAQAPWETLACPRSAFSGSAHLDLAVATNIAMHPTPR
jgi:hypothetical protein